MEVRCRAGYRYSLKRTAHLCVETRLFSPELGTCLEEESNQSTEEVKMCPPAKIANTENVSTSPTPAKSWIKIMCKPGYSYSLASDVHKCQPNGTYATKFGVCEPPPLKCEQRFCKLLYSFVNPDFNIKSFTYKCQINARSSIKTVSRD